MDNGHWHDRFTKTELAAQAQRIGNLKASNKVITTLMVEAYNQLQGTAAFSPIADEVSDAATVLATTKGAYEEAGILFDMADCLREMEEEFAAHMNLPIRRDVIAEDRKHASEQDRQHDGTCEHGHLNCNPIGDKCGDECD